MSPWLHSVYSPSQVRELDQRAIAHLDVSGYELMCRAGQYAFDMGFARFTQARHWLVLCGSGNNAGDGYVIARLARAAGIEVTVVAITDPSCLNGDAYKAFDDFRAAGGETQAYDPVSCQAGDLIIDAMLGTGIDRDLEGPYLAAVKGVNLSDKPIVAVDIPTGINGLTGEVMGVAINADVTVSFVGLKIGLFLADGLNHGGELLFDDLGIPPSLSADMVPGLLLFGEQDLAELLPVREPGSHKGMFGHVLVVGGNYGMAGAARMCAEAALRAGSGLVSVATRQAGVAAILSGRPELMVHALEDAADLSDLITRCSVIALGPGLGRDEWAKRCFDRLVQVDKPKVLDADALNILAEYPQHRNDWVLTPHPGEAARLLGVSVAEVQSDRLSAVQALQSRYGGVAVLKGHGTLIAGEQSVPFVVNGGNPGMATAGMGDVLTGVVAAILGQTGGLQAPAAAAAYAHALAGDRAASEGERGMLASDLLQHLRTVLNP